MGLKNVGFGIFAQDCMLVHLFENVIPRTSKMSVHSLQGVTIFEYLNSFLLMDRQRYLFGMGKSVLPERIQPNAHLFFRQSMLKFQPDSI